MASVCVRIFNRSFTRTALYALSVHQNRNDANIPEVLNQAATLVRDYVPKGIWIDTMSQFNGHFIRECNHFILEMDDSLTIDSLPPIDFQQLLRESKNYLSDNSQTIAMTGSSFVASILAGVPTALLINPQSKLLSTLLGVTAAAIVGLPVTAAKRAMEQGVLKLAIESGIDAKIKVIPGQRFCNTNTDSQPIDPEVEDFLRAFENTLSKGSKQKYSWTIEDLIKESRKFSFGELISAFNLAKGDLERSKESVSKVKELLSEKLGLSTEKEMSIVGVLAMSILVPAVFNVFEVVKVQLQSGKSLTDIRSFLKDPKVMLKGLTDTILRNLTWNGVFQALLSKGASFEASFMGASAMSLPHNILKSLSQAGFDNPNKILKEMLTMPGTHRTRVFAAAASVAAMMVAAKVGGAIKELAENPDRVSTELALRKEICRQLVEGLELPEGYSESLFLESLC